MTARDVSIDLTDPGFMQNPYPQLAALQEATPITFYEPTGQWLVTRHELVHAALRDKRMGRAWNHRYTAAELGRPEPDERWADFAASERWSLLNLEPPDHTRIRSLVAKVFTPKAVNVLRPEVEAVAARVLAPLLERATFDVIVDYAQPYSVEVICNWLGVPATDSRLLLDWSHAIVKMYELDTTDEQRVAANAAARDFISYVESLIADKRRRPDDALVSQLVAVEEEGTRLTADEIVCTVIVLLNAGHEATVNTLGNGMRAFWLHPEQWQRVTSGEVAPRSAIEEMLRWDAPLQLFERWVLDEGVEIAGQPLRVGDEIAMLFGAANRDPRHFPEPERFDVGRGDATHVGFGGGIHFCVGAPLARLELEASVTEIARHLTRIEAVTEPRYHRAFVIHGLTGLEIATR
jgi:cytochrome P450